MIRLDGSAVRVLAPIDQLYYYDVQNITLDRELSPLEAWNLITQHPQPLLRLAFRIRDAISALFGVKRIQGFSTTRVESVEIGDHLDFFLVEYTDHEALVLTERDKHLDVMTCISTAGQTVSVTSSVQVHNWFGRAYMLPVGIAHRWIVRGMLRRLQREATR
ncbi:DUF2867 domain-containing protein [Loktanella sp. S4079]|uniref:DUF2867 domain-containing protein n=1 Tax=Loktanella sp. S4079 TaxID=579483 RepID=UPI0005FA2F7D|nr:DUF2867 domain-containing protein [Loktanella sp. S4079]KJZ19116.1 hypothetical protein TW80_09940 [Loktanella sp. S4079]